MFICCTSKLSNLLVLLSFYRQRVTDKRRQSSVWCCYLARAVPLIWKKVNLTDWLSDTQRPNSSDGFRVVRGIFRTSLKYVLNVHQRKKSEEPKRGFLYDSVNLHEAFCAKFVFRFFFVFFILCCPVNSREGERNMCGRVWKRSDQHRNRSAPFRVTGNADTSLQSLRHEMCARVCRIRCVCACVCVCVCICAILFCDYTSFL